MKAAQPVLALAVIVALTGCFGNPAKIRAFASALQSLTGDAPGFIAADEASCEQNAALQDEYKELEDQQLSPPPCKQLAGVLQSILAENKVLKAYADALNNMAQNQFVATDTDAKAVTGTLESVGVVSAPVVAAVGSVFSLIETAALNGYRQNELSKAMTGGPATAFKTIMVSYTQLADQYSGALDRQLSNIELTRNAIKHDYQKKEPVAIAEMSVRFDALRDDVAAKAAAVKDFTAALAKVNPAFDAAVQDLSNPNAKEIYESVKAFATQAKDAHDKLKKAFGEP